MTTDRLIVRRSDSPLDDVCARLPEISQKHTFGVLGVHNLKEKMASKGVDFARECRIFEVCNPQQAKSVLERSMAVSTALPCRISVYEQDGQTVLATIKPTTLLSLFDAPGAADAARSIEQTMIEILDEAAAS